MDRSIKAAQLADQIRDYLAAWTAQDFPGARFSLTEVTLTPDLLKATVWVESFDPEVLRTTLPKLAQKANTYRGRLYQSLQRRGVPFLSFLPDERAKMAQTLDSL